MMIALRRRSIQSFSCAVLALAMAGAAHTTIPASDPAREQAWDFRVLLNDQPIGYHRFTLSPRGEGRELHSRAQFDVKFLFINAYHYDHEAHETWQGDCLEGLESSSEDNGKSYRVSISRRQETLQVDAPPRHYAVSGCAMTFAYWNPVMLQQSHLINPETGENVSVSIQPVGEEDIQVRGSGVRARHWHLHAEKMEIDLWYSMEGQWLALESPSGGRRLRYILN